MLDATVVGKNVVGIVVVSGMESAKYETNADVDGVREEMSTWLCADGVVCVTQTIEARDEG